MRKCAKECVKNNKECNNKECSLWIDFPKELNCSLISIEKNGNMTLKECGERLGISYCLVKKIQDKVLLKLKKNFQDFS